jgi:hypothetical protein
MLPHEMEGLMTLHQVAQQARKAARFDGFQL